MITGDNLFTAVEVARQCHIVSDNRPLYSLDVFKVTNDGNMQAQTSTNAAENLEGNAHARNEQLSLTLLHTIDERQGMENIEKRLDLKGIDGEETSAANDIKWLFELLSTEVQVAITDQALSLLRTIVEKLKQDELSKIIQRCVVFARMRPESKKFIVEQFQQQQNTNSIFSMDSMAHGNANNNSSSKFIVAMCGDGSNDCLALKVPTYPAKVCSNV